MRWSQRRARAVVLGLVLGASGACVAPRAREGGQCVFNGDCENPLICAWTGCRAQCRSDRDCPAGTACYIAGQPSKNVCLPRTQAAPCLSNTDCPTWALCVTGDHTCRARCASDAECAARGAGTCRANGACSEPISISDVVGAGPPPLIDGGADASTLDTGLTDAGDLDSNTPDTNTPDTSVADTGITPPVEAGTCTLSTRDCDNNPANGCETDVRSSAMHCNGCGMACPSAANARPSCESARCALACELGFGNCDGMASNGCELSVASDMRNCGACGRVCPTRPNADGACLLGECALTCRGAFRDCDANVANGCEVDTTNTPAHCGACGRACPLPTDLCVMGSCRASPYASDGSEGDLAPMTNIALTAGVHQFRNIDIPAGVTVRVATQGVLELRASGTVNIRGTVDLSGGNGGDGAERTGVTSCGGVGGGGHTGTTISGTTSMLSACSPAGVGGVSLFGVGESQRSVAVGCGSGGVYGGGAGGSGGFSGGGGGGRAGGGAAGGTGSASGGASGRSIVATYSTGGDTRQPTGISTVYLGGDGPVLSGDLRLAGGGSIGIDAAQDLAVSSTFYPGSGGGGGAGYSSLDCTRTNNSAGGPGGGGGGGALLVASPSSVTVHPTGELLANGGRGGNAQAPAMVVVPAAAGGGGSGGVIVIAAPRVTLQGRIEALGGAGGRSGALSAGRGGLGRIRLVTTAAQCELGTGINPPPPSTGCAPVSMAGEVGRMYTSAWPPL